MRLPNGYEMESTFWQDFSIDDILQYKPKIFIYSSFE